MSDEFFPFSRKKKTHSRGHVLQITKKISKTGVGIEQLIIDRNWIFYNDEAQIQINHVEHIYKLITMAIKFWDKNLYSFHYYREAAAINGLSPILIWK